MSYNPDKKARQLLDHYYALFASNTFDEKDVYAFFILSRDFIKDHRFVNKYGAENWISHVCHLIAHRERDRGVIFDSLKAVRQIPANHRGKISGSQGIEPKDFVDMFNYFLETIGYDSLTEKTILDILLCAFSLMQFSVYYDAMAKQHVGEVSVLITQQQISLITAGTHVVGQADKLHVRLSYVDNTYTTTDFFSQGGWHGFCQEPMIVKRNNGKLVVEYDGKII